MKLKIQKQKMNINVLTGLVISKLKLIIISMVIFGLAGFFIAEFMLDKQYEATAQIYIVGRQVDSSGEYTDAHAYPILANDYKTLLTGKSVVEKVIAELGISIEAARLVDKAVITVVPESRILSITVTDKNPYNAKIIADVWADIASESICSIMEVEAANIFEYGSASDKAVNSKVALYIILGMLLGAVIEIGIVVILYLMNDTIKNQEDVDTYLGLDTLALIPSVQEGRNRGGYNRTASGANGRRDER